MIRNVNDNHRQENPYTTRDTNLRLGKFYSNSLDLGAARKPDKGGGFKLRTVSAFENKL